MMVTVYNVKGEAVALVTLAEFLKMSNIAGVAK